MERRDEVWARVRGNWDVIVIGGGITGAGVFAHASRLGLKCLLIERRDFGWGTSSRSGKLVHGGLRYLKQGQWRMTLHSVHERERLLRLYPGLIRRLGFLMPFYGADRAARPLIKTGLFLYDGMAGRRTHRWLGESALTVAAPMIRRAGLIGGYRFEDAQTDDARLVWRVMEEGRACGGTSLNYAAALSIDRDRGGGAEYVTVEDALTGQIAEVEAPVIVNATGVWIDGMLAALSPHAPLRRLRGSHLLFPHWRFPLSQAVSFAHPEDGRPVYAVPWEGATLFGTTDIDHDQSLTSEPCITPSELDYLFAALDSMFPSLNLSLVDAISAYSGVRSVIDTGKSNPSDESREHAIWAERGVISVVGGKLTTYRLLAAQALSAAKPFLRGVALQNAEGGDLSQVREGSQRAGWAQPGEQAALSLGQVVDGQSTDGREAQFSAELAADWESAADRENPERTRVRERLQGRFGRAVGMRLWRGAAEAERSALADTDISAAELKWAAGHEDVVHLDDLLLRRTRLGLLAKQGGIPLLARLRPAIQPELGWSDAEWRREAERYRDLWLAAYSPQPSAAAARKGGDN
ncbi:MAG: glycerol-3-phosphate dehydrogenase/oxidase [Bacilli bacterium]